MKENSNRSFSKDKNENTAFCKLSDLLNNSNNKISGRQKFTNLNEGMNIRFRKHQNIEKRHQVNNSSLNESFKSNNSYKIVRTEYNKSPEKKHIKKEFNLQHSQRKSSNVSYLVPRPPSNNKTSNSKSPKQTRPNSAYSLNITKKNNSSAFNKKPNNVYEYFTSAIVGNNNNSALTSLYTTSKKPNLMLTGTNPSLMKNSDNETAHTSGYEKLVKHNNFKLCIHQEKNKTEEAGQMSVDKEHERKLDKSPSIQKVTSLVEKAKKIRGSPRESLTKAWRKKTPLEYEITQNVQDILDDYQNIITNKENLNTNPEGDYFLQYNSDEIINLAKFIGRTKKNLVAIVKLMDKYLRDARYAIYLKKAREGKDFEGKSIMNSQEDMLLRKEKLNTELQKLHTNESLSKFHMDSPSREKIFNDSTCFGEKESRDHLNLEAWNSNINDKFYKEENDDSNVFIMKNLWPIEDNETEYNDLEKQMKKNCSLNKQNIGKNINTKKKDRPYSANQHLNTTNSLKPGKKKCTKFEGHNKSNIIGRKDPINKNDTKEVFQYPPNNARYHDLVKGNLKESSRLLSKQKELYGVNYLLDEFAEQISRKFEDEKNVNKNETLNGAMSSINNQSDKKSLYNRIVEKSLIVPDMTVDYIKK